MFTGGGRIRDSPPSGLGEKKREAEQLNVAKCREYGHRGPKCNNWAGKGKVQNASRQYNRAGGYVPQAKIKLLCTSKENQRGAAPFSRKKIRGHRSIRAVEGPQE